MDQESLIAPESAEVPARVGVRPVGKWLKSNRPGCCILDFSPDGDARLRGIEIPHLITSLGFTPLRIFCISRLRIGIGPDFLCADRLPPSSQENRRSAREPDTQGRSFPYRIHCGMRPKWRKVHRTAFAINSGAKLPPRPNGNPGRLRWLGRPHGRGCAPVRRGGRQAASSSARRQVVCAERRGAAGLRRDSRSKRCPDRRWIRTVYVTWWPVLEIREWRSEADAPDPS